MTDTGKIGTATAADGPFDRSATCVNRAVVGDTNASKSTSIQVVERVGRMLRGYMAVDNDTVVVVAEG